MEKGGWVFNNIGTGLYNARCNAGTWHGYRNTTKQVGETSLSAIFRGHGIVELKIRNCGFDDNATVRIFLNEKEIGRVYKMAKKYFKIRYSPNDTMQIKPISGNQFGAIIDIFYVQILCGSNNISSL